MRLVVDEGIQTRPHTSFGFECLACPDQDPAIGPELPGGGHPASPRDLPDNTDGRDRCGRVGWSLNGMVIVATCHPVPGSCMCPNIDFWLLGSPHH